MKILEQGPVLFDAQNDFLFSSLAVNDVFRFGRLCHETSIERLRPISKGMKDMGAGSRSQPSGSRGFRGVARALRGSGLSAEGWWGLEATNFGGCGRRRSAVALKPLGAAFVPGYSGVWLFVFILTPVGVSWNEERWRGRWQRP